MKKSHMNWSWILIVLFFVLSIVNVYFGLLGLICMTMPIYHALRKRGKVHCAKYCPRGSFLGKFLSKISLHNNLPKWMTTKLFKNSLLGVMLLMLSISMIHSRGSIPIIAFSLFRFMGVSFIVGILLGIFFKPRSWCSVCPMGNMTHKISKIV